jgi:hypothetical protein
MKLKLSFLYKNSSSMYSSNLFWNWIILNIK